MKRYLFSFLAALLCHSLFFLLPKTKDNHSQLEEDLVEFQLMNEELKPEEPPPEVVTPPPPPPPQTKVEPEKPPEEVEPEPDVLAEEEEIVEKKIVKATPPAQPPSAVTSNEVNGVVGGVITDASQLDNARFKPFGNKKPGYPSIARKAGIEGWVKVRVLVDEKGKVVKVEVLDYSGHPSFKQATIDVAEGWRFPVPTVGNKRVRTWYEKKIGFMLRD